MLNPKNPYRKPTITTITEKEKDYWTDKIWQAFGIPKKFRGGDYSYSTSESFLRILEREQDVIKDIVGASLLSAGPDDEEEDHDYIKDPTEDIIDEYEEDENNDEE